MSDFGACNQRGFAAIAPASLFHRASGLWLSVEVLLWCFPGAVKGSPKALLVPSTFVVAQEHT